MSVIDVIEKPSQEEYEGTSSDRRARRVFTVLVSDAVNDTSVAACAATGIPRIGDPHPDDYFLRVQSVRASRTGSPTLYTVDVTYQTPVYPPQSDPNAAGQTNPLMRPADISGGSAESLEPIDMDIDGGAIVNSLGHGFDPPLQEPISDIVVVIERNQPTLDLLLIGSYKNATNSDVWSGAEAGRCLMKDISWRRVIEGTFTYFRVRYEIHYRYTLPTGVTAAKAWYRRVLNQDFYYLNGSSKVVRAMDEATPPREMVHMVTLKADSTRATAGAEYWLEFHTKPSQPFANLHLL